MYDDLHNNSSNLINITLLRTFELTKYTGWIFLLYLSYDYVK